MKKIAILLVALLAIQVTSHAQRQGHAKKGERANKMMNLSAEEIATLQTKKMTLHYDLNESQQAKIQAINLENATKRKAMMEARKARKESGDAQRPSKEERLKMANAKLDHKIAMKAKMKDILNDEQYAKWEKAQSKMAMKSKNRGLQKGKNKKKQ